MVPITIAYFGDPSGNRRDASSKAIFFAAGIVAAYTLLGVFLSLVVGASGLNRFAADPIVNLLLAFVFVLFAANLFGWVELRLPSGLVNAADRAARRQSGLSSLAAALVGATFTVTSLTCTAPIVGTLLVLAARGSWTTPLLGMLAYSIAFALPFYLLARAPQALERLPRAGEWMRTLRVIVGILEIAAALKFASNTDVVLGWGVLTRSIVLIGWTVLFGATGIFLGRGIFRSKEQRLSLVRVFGTAACVVMGVWLATGISGRSLTGVEAFLPPAVQRGDIAAARSGETWMLNDLNAALAAGRTTNKLVFVDFTGYTCTNCRWMEANIFSRPEVSGALSAFVLARLYTDGEGDVYERQQAYQEKTFGTVALPLYAVIDADGKVIDTFSGLTRDPAEFVGFLNRAKLKRVALD
jgi:thiol:disulfide interchange protein DsbD